MKLNGISASRIATYDQCLFKYFLVYHLKTRMKSNFGALNGSIVHHILERFASNVDSDWMNQLYLGYAGKLEVTNNFDELEILESPLIYAKPKEYADVKPYCDICPFADIKNGVCSISQESLDSLPGCPKAIFEETVDMVRDVIKSYEQKFKDHLLYTEKKIVIDLPGCAAPITCIIDLILQYGDTVEIVDYKAGKWTKDFGECRKDTQVRIVSWAARKYFIENGSENGHNDIKNIIVTFDYFRKRPVTLAFTPEEDAETEAFLIEKGNKMASQKRVTRVVGNRDPSKDWRCSALCDPSVCKREWKGSFTLDDNDG
jgi:hypothetical protein